MQKKKSSKVNKRISGIRISGITLVLIVAVIAIIVTILNKSNKPAEIEAEKLITLLLDDSGVSFAGNGIVDEKKLKEIQNIPYDELKNMVNTENDFCVFLEDENGKIILAKGSAKLARDGVGCKE